MKRLQVAAMVALLALGFWLAVGPAIMQRRIDATPGAMVMRLEIGGRKLRVERIEHDQWTVSYRFLTHAPDLPRDIVDPDTFWKTLRGVETKAGPRHFVLDALNISSWWGVGWVALGFLGQGAFFFRMLVQWLASERAKRSVVPAAFWWLSLFGGATLFFYFVWRRDVVGVMGQSAGVVIYARNLALLRAGGAGGARSGDAAREQEDANPQAV